MIVHVILVLSVLLLVGAGLVAYRMVRITSRSRAWVILSFTILLMGIYRLMALYSVDSEGPAGPRDIVAAIVALGTSALFFVGIYYFQPLINDMVRDKVTRLVLAEQLDEAEFEIINRLAMAAEYRDDNTGQHSTRIAELAGALAETIGLSREHADLIRRAAPLHDVGKIAIPDSVLLKPGPLSPEEWELMKTHTRIGGKILSSSEFPLLKKAEEIALTHHENWDGSGYHRGLHGIDIPLSGRILAVVDVYDALTSPRSYKPAWSSTQALQTISELAGTKFDPAIVAAFLEMMRFTAVPVRYKASAGAAA